MQTKILLPKDKYSPEFLNHLKENPPKFGLNNQISIASNAEDIDRGYESRINVYWRIFWTEQDLMDRGISTECTGTCEDVFVFDGKDPSRIACVVEGELVEI